MTRDFSVVALVAAYNEADILPAVIRALVAEGVGVYLLDHGSTDDTRQVLEPFLGQGLLAIEPFPGERFPQAQEAFSWSAILERKRELSMELDADWFIHHDADEFRESIWEGVSLRDAIQRVDALGYNAIDFEVFNFWPTDNEFEPGTDPRSALPYYAAKNPWDKLQVKCWKKTTASPDLHSSGGHDVMFPGRQVFPLRFLLRHYPVRSQSHGEQKVFTDRRPRFVADERATGWHVQYDAFDEKAQFVKDPATLIEYDSRRARLHALSRHRGVDDLADRIDSLTQQLARRDDSLRALRAELGQRHEQLARAGEQNEHLEAALAAHQVEISRLDNELQALHASKSWRWMAPLRAIYGLVRRP